MPLYNAQPFVGQAVRSILDQTHRDLLLFVVDDGSTDDSAREAELAFRRDDRAFIIRRGHNIGEYATRNQLLELARASKAELIAWQDADDWSARIRLASQVEEFQRGFRGVLGTQCAFILRDGTYLANTVYETPTDAHAAFLRHQAPVVFPSLMLRTADAPIFSVTGTLDDLLWQAALLDLGVPFKSLATPWALYYVRHEREGQRPARPVPLDWPALVQRHQAQLDCSLCHP